MRIDTWIGNALMTVETEDVWAETFAHWDTLVPSDVAANIATATVKVLEASDEQRRHIDSVLRTI